MIKQFILAFLLLFSFIDISAQEKKMSRDDYISRYKAVAIKEMNRTGIPASITLAQGLLESDNGNSRLAKKANNHFGIKCHNWSGKSIYHDDDEKDECFRKYGSADESYRDHSDFLKTTRRYEPLFSLGPTDYKAWAKGLKKAGYATSPSYAEDLIRLIEANNLHQYDQVLVVKMKRRERKEKERLEEKARREAVEKAEADAKLGREQERVSEPVEEERADQFYVDINRRPVFERNNREYVMTRSGDTYESLTRELALMPWEIAMFNDMLKGAKLIPGVEIFLQPKKNRAARGYDFHMVEPNETMFTISQHYGMKLSQLYRKNHLDQGSEPAAGTKLWLRKTKPGIGN